MRYEVEYAIGYDHGAWEAYWVDVDMAEEDSYVDPHEFLRDLEEAAGEQLLEDLGPNTHESFCIVLSYFEKE